MLRKTVIITGASGGIGSATAVKFAKEGYNLALTYCNGDVSRLTSILNKLDANFKFYQLDQRNEESIRAFVTNVFKDFEYVDSCICNAGIAARENLLINQKTQEIDDILNVNLRGSILLNREVAYKFVRQQHGNIINVASIHGLSGGSCEAAYSASKAGIIGLTKALASEVGQYNIRVNAVAPGFIDTNMTAGYNSEERAAAIQKTPLKRLGEAEDVADLLYFLASDNASFITGECYQISGGVVKF